MCPINNRRRGEKAWIISADKRERSDCLQAAEPKCSFKNKYSVKEHLVQLLCMSEFNLYTAARCGFISAVKEEPWRRGTVKSDRIIPVIKATKPTVSSRVTRLCDRVHKTTNGRNYRRTEETPAEATEVIALTTVLQYPGSRSTQTVHTVHCHNGVDRRSVLSELFWSQIFNSDTGSSAGWQSDWFKPE